MIFDHAARDGQVLTALEALIAAGKLVYDEDIATGFEAAPGAIARLYAGANGGKSLIIVG